MVSEITSEDFIRKVYLDAKSNISSRVDRKNWIWADYFSDENGFDYFKQTYMSDIDNIKECIYKETSTEEEMIDGVSDYIRTKMLESDFTNIAQQSMLEYPM